MFEEYNGCIYKLDRYFKMIEKPTPEKLRSIALQGAKSAAIDIDVRIKQNDAIKFQPVVGKGSGVGIVELDKILSEEKSTDTFWAKFNAQYNALSQLHSLETQLLAAQQKSKSTDTILRDSKKALDDFLREYPRLEDTRVASEIAVAEDANQHEIDHARIRDDIAKLDNIYFNLPSGSKLTVRLERIWQSSYGMDRTSREVILVDAMTSGPREAIARNIQVSKYLQDMIDKMTSQKYTPEQQAAFEAQVEELRAKIPVLASDVLRGFVQSVACDLEAFCKNYAKASKVIAEFQEPLRQIVAENAESKNPVHNHLADKILNDKDMSAGVRAKLVYLLAVSATKDSKANEHLNEHLNERLNASLSHESNMLAQTILKSNKYDDATKIHFIDLLAETIEEELAAAAQLKTQQNIVKNTFINVMADHESDTRNISKKAVLAEVCKKLPPELHNLAGQMLDRGAINHVFPKRKGTISLLRAKAMNMFARREPKKSHAAAQQTQIKPLPSNAANIDASPARQISAKTAFLLIFLVSLS
jgi:hypothetical protein